MDLLQAPHTFSGIEMALWDLMGKKYNEPVWSLLGYKDVFPKLAYFSVLFGDNPDITYMRARDAKKLGEKVTVKRCKKIRKNKSIRTFTDEA